MKARQRDHLGRFRARIAIEFGNTCRVTHNWRLVNANDERDASPPSEKPLDENRKRNRHVAHRGFFLWLFLLLLLLLSFFFFFLVLTDPRK